MSRHTNAVLKRFRPGRGFFLGLCAIICFWGGCEVFEKPEKEIVLSVGSFELGVLELKRDMDFITSGMGLPLRHRAEIRGKLVERLIEHYLVLEYAKSENITVSKKELTKALEGFRLEYSEKEFKEALLKGYVDREAWEELIRQRLVVKKVLTVIGERVDPPLYEEIKAYFEKNRDRFNSPRRIEFRQIVTQSREKAEKILKRVQGGEDFGELARQFSETPEAANGGVVGPLARENLEKTMAEALFRLPVGQPSGVVKTPYGYHILEVLKVHQAREPELPELREKIEARILSAKKERYIGNWLKDIRKEVKVHVNNELLEKMELS